MTAQILFGYFTKLIVISILFSCIGAHDRAMSLFLAIKIFCERFDLSGKISIITELDAIKPLPVTQVMTSDKSFFATLGDE